MAQGSTAFNLGFDAYRGWSYSDDVEKPVNPFNDAEDTDDWQRMIDWNMGWTAAEVAEADYMKYLEEMEACNAD